MSYDARCLDLAGVFLSDEPTLNTPEMASALAQDIQSAVESFIAEQKRVEAGKWK